MPSMIVLVNLKEGVSPKDHERRIPGAIRLRPGEATSARVTRRLNKTGFRAAALAGGYDAWKEGYRVEPFPGMVGEPAGSRPGA